MFDFLMDAGNYDSRKVGRDDFSWGFISTARVSDGRKPYETAVEHPEYNAGKMVIVECYDSREEAEAGHAKWIATMTTGELPAKLVDCANAEIAQMMRGLGGEMEYPRATSPESSGTHQESIESK